MTASASDTSGAATDISVTQASAIMLNMANLNDIVGTPNQLLGIHVIHERRSCKRKMNIVQNSFWGLKEPRIFNRLSQVNRHGLTQGRKGSVFWA